MKIWQKLVPRKGRSDYKGAEVETRVECSTDRKGAGGWSRVHEGKAWGKSSWRNK